MQDVPLIQNAASSTLAANRTALFGGVSTSSGAGADIFQTFMDHESSLGQSGSTYAAAPSLDTVFSDAVQTSPARTETSTQRSDSRRNEKKKDEPDLNDMRDVPVSSESFQEMKPQLEQYGLSESDVQELEKRVESKEGMTWGQLVSAISDKMGQKGQNVELTSAQRQKMMTLFQQLGFSSTEAKGMVSEVSKGNVDKVLDALGRRMQNLPPEKLAGLDKDELKDVMSELRKLKGNLDGKELGLVRVIGKSMQEALEQARQKAMQLAQEKNAGTKAETMADAARNAARQDASKAAALNENLTDADAARKNQRIESGLTRNLDLEARLKAGSGKVAQSVADGSRFNQGKGSEQFTKQDAGTNGDAAAWGEFMSKLRQDRSDMGSLRTGGQDLQSVMGEALSQARGESSQSAGKAWQNTSAPRLLNQVQDAVTRSLAGGGKRLTIQLNPQELGTLSVAITVKNKEVQALIRTDNHETAKLVSGHLEALRQSLEDQGLKVTKMEVQTQLANQDAGQQWMGEQGHNQAQDEQVRQQVRQRMNALRGQAGAGGDLAADVRQAILSGNGLHVVA